MKMNKTPLLSAAILTCTLLAMPFLHAEQPAPQAWMPKLTDDVVNQKWYHPEDTTELIYLGTSESDSTGDISLILDRNSIHDGLMQLSIETDAESVSFLSDNSEFSVSLTGRENHVLALQTTPRVARVFLDGIEYPSARGRWIRMLLGENSTINVTFNDATYVNLQFLNHAISAQRNASSVTGHTSIPNRERQISQPVATTSHAMASPGQQPGLSIANHGTQAGTSSIATTPEPDSSQEVRVLRRLNRENGAVVSTMDSGQIGPLPMPGDHDSTFYGPENLFKLSLSAGTNFPTAYFYRGIGRENQGLIVQPYLELQGRLFKGNPSRDGLLGSVINEINLHVGMQPTFANGPFGYQTYGEAWTEIIFIAGGSVRFFDRWTFLVEYENVESIRTSYRDVHQVNFMLGFDDHDPRYPFSLQPYALVSWEFEHQSDGGWLTPANAKSPKFKRGVYLELGIEPGFDLFKWYLNEPVKLSIPIKAGFSLYHYYENPKGKDDFFGYASIGLMGHIPLASWNATGGRTLDISLTAGVEFLFLGSSARQLSQAVGTGTSNFVPIGIVGIHFAY